MLSGATRYRVSSIIRSRRPLQPDWCPYHKYLLLYVLSLSTLYGDPLPFDSAYENYNKKMGNIIHFESHRSLVRCVVLHMICSSRYVGVLSIQYPRTQSLHRVTSGVDWCRPEHPTGVAPQLLQRLILYNGLRCSIDGD